MAEPVSVKRSSARGCLIAALLLLLVVLVLIMMGLIVGKAKTTPWPEPIPGVDLSLPYEGVDALTPTNGFYHLEALNDLGIKWPREINDHVDVAPLVDYGGTSLVAFVAANPKVKEVVHQAANAPIWRIKGPIHFDMEMLGVRPAINQAKFHRWVLAEQARRGDWASFEQTAADQLAIAGGMNSGNLILEMVSIALYNIVAEELIGIASTTNLPVAVSQALRQELVAHEPSPEELANTMRFEGRLMLMNIPQMRQIALAMNNFDVPEWVCRRGSTRTKHNLETFLSLTVYEAGQTQPGDSPGKDWLEQSAGDGAWIFLSDDPGGRLIVSEFWSPCQTIIRDHRKARATMRGAQIVLAIEEFKQTRGRTPQTLEELVPDILDALPVDPFSTTQKPLRGVLHENSWRIYSVGADHIDGGGNLPSGTDHFTWRQASDLIIRPTRHMEATKGHSP